MHVAVSECGHVSLPVWDEDSFALACHLRSLHGFASVEEVLSGRGLLALNGFCTGPRRAATAPDLMARLSDPTDAGDRRTADLFCAVLGRVLGDLALVHLPWGGLFLIGGLARATAPLLPHHGFSENFTDKGRFSGFMNDFSIFLVEDDFSALTGCTDYARAALR
jgi:glucokinase